MLQAEEEMFLPCRAREHRDEGAATGEGELEGFVQQVPESMKVLPSKN